MSPRTNESAPEKDTDPDTPTPAQEPMRSTAAEVTEVAESAESAEETVAVAGAAGDASGQDRGEGGRTADAATAAGDRPGEATAVKATDDGRPGRTPAANALPGKATADNPPVDALASEDTSADQPGTTPTAETVGVGEPGGSGAPETVGVGEPGGSGAPETVGRGGTSTAARVPGSRGTGGTRPEPARRRVLSFVACAAALAVAFTGGAIALGGRDEGPGVSLSSSGAISAAQLARGDLDSTVSALQAHLKQQPRDFGSWSTLGLAYVEQARTKGDPSRYPQAEKAVERSLELRPDNDQALAARAALAAARHQFEKALKDADRALKVNPYSERALSTRVDALVELGRYDEALKAVKLADSRQPGVPVFTRYAYVYELRGDVKTARRVLKQALATSTAPGDVAYVATQLGQLAWKQGDYKTSLDYYARALGADDTYLPALEGRARAQAASGDTEDSVTGLEQVVSGYPLPGPLVVLGELYEAEGRKTEARDQYALVNAWTSIARANGVNADLDTALAAADHGDKKAALRAARAEWQRRETVHTADALAWALHVNGKDDEALPYARRATATGYQDAAFLYHRGMVEYAAGDKKEARAWLTAALDLNPGFSPLGAAKARKTLKALKAAEADK